MISHQATCVSLSGGAVLIEGAPGTGKSSLALALIDRGAVLIGDDSLHLEAHTGQLFARPHPNTRGLLELRNLGLIPFPVCEEAAVALVIMLDANAPRFIECAETTYRAGIKLPLIRLWPEGPLAPIKVELALGRHGLTSGSASLR